MWKQPLQLKHHQWTMLARRHVAALVDKSAWPQLATHFTENFLGEPLCSDEIIPALAALGGGGTADLGEIAAGATDRPELLFDFLEKGGALEKYGVAAECPMFVYWPGCLTEDSDLGLLEPYGPRSWCDLRLAACDLLRSHSQRATHRAHSQQLAAGTGLTCIQWCLVSSCHSRLHLTQSMRCAPRAFSSRERLRRLPQHSLPRLRLRASALRMRNRSTEMRLPGREEHRRPRHCLAFCSRGSGTHQLAVVGCGGLVVRRSLRDSHGIGNGRCISRRKHKLWLHPLDD